ncbi:MAG: NAD(P)H-hydrate dehydratase [Clostridiaceae bacterium]|jgi:hydroxyethylthiazole kinase-like uncharacterized protein yjeF|nr:NAD(P)H-hydrate dehydratase [Clostridiaceae bacterium]
MARLIDGKEQKKLDQAFCEKTGLPMLTLMEQAAAKMTEEIESALFCDSDVNVLVVTGSGNNGGDGWASARQLMAKGYRVIVYDAAPNSALTIDAAAQRDAFHRLGGCVITDAADIEGKGVCAVLDALFGTGFSASRPLDATTKAAFTLMKDLAQAGAKVIACDVPSGLDAKTGAVIPETVKADMTVTFGRNKVGLVTHPGCLYSDRVVCAPISMTDAFVDEVLGEERISSLNDDIMYPLLPQRPKDAHKGQFGKALLLGGAEGMIGALILAARACSKTGAGYTMLRAPESSLPVLASAVPSALISAVPTGKDTKRDLPEPTVIAIGPGAGDAPWVTKALSHLLLKDVPIVIDADGLNALARMPNASNLFEKRAASGAPPAVLTPHPGEFRRLAPDLAETLELNRIEAARALALRWKVIVVLKGMATVIAMPDGRAWINTTGDSSLAKAGSGDVLTGMIAGMIAQSPCKDGDRLAMNEVIQQTMEGAVARAVYAHGLAAKFSTQEINERFGTTPEDIVDAIRVVLSATYEDCSVYRCRSGLSFL